MITLDAVKDPSINTVIEQIQKENVMKTLLLSFMQKHTSDGLTFRASETRQAAVVRPPLLPLCNPLFRYLAGFMLVGAAVLDTCRRLMRIIPLPRLTFTATV
jgi:hypothetical protein